jgi:hypothetical protein
LEHFIMSEPTAKRAAEAAFKAALIPVTMRALIQRINRKLAQNDEGRWPQKVCAFRGRSRTNVGHYYLLCISRNMILDSDINPEHLAQELHLLQPWEAVVDEKTIPAL